MQDVISVHGLVKYFGRTCALDKLEVTAKRGEVHAILGSSGAGKTTAIRIMLGLLHPDAGRVHVFDTVPWGAAGELHRRIAYVQGEVSLWPNMTGGEVIDLTARMHGGVDAARRDLLLKLFDVDPACSGYTYDKRARQRVALIAALASRAELLVLDEPTAGLDLAEQEALRELIAAERAGGRTVVVTSRVLAEVESVADRVTVIDRGRTVETGTLADLRHLTRTTLSAELDNPDAAIGALEAVHNFELRRNTVRCDVDSDHLDAVLRRMLDCGMRSLTSRPATLEELLTRRTNSVKVGSNL